jgi:hypothetical protein
MVRAGAGAEICDNLEPELEPDKKWTGSATLINNQFLLD